MVTTQSSGQEGIDARTMKAATGCMVVYGDDHPTGSGLFDVYSAKNGNNEIYTVDLVGETCDCPDAEYNLDSGEACKHARRVKLALGIMDLPGGIDAEEIDSMLANNREKYGGSPVSEAQTPVSAGDNTASGRVATDGGQFVEEPATDDLEITRHFESPEQGAAAYYRCACGREAMRERDLESESHREECDA